VDAEVRLLVAILDAAYDRKSWHGTNLRGSIRGVTARQAAWRPSRNRHNISELVVHTAYWKYAVFRRLSGAARGSFPLRGSNWFPRENSGEATWRKDVALLDQMHRSLRAAVTRLSALDLAHTPRGSKVSTFAILSGVVAHDLYHAGQIQLLKKLQK
jgi:uncharacterized damage-inducible protein DinB